MSEAFRILLVEDEALIALFLIRQLKSLGFQVGKPVATGEEAVLRAKEERPDLILMDIRLAGRMNGFQAAQEIHLHQTIPVAFMTGYPSENMKEQTQMCGPVAYLEKPVDIYAVKELIEKLCTKKDLKPEEV
jgi:two-component system, response regulator PdtaR